jgi:hypothetical protein
MMRMMKGRVCCSYLGSVGSVGRLVLKWSALTGRVLSGASTRSFIGLMMRIGW